MGCLWQNEHVLTVSLSGAINYLDVSPAAEQAVKRTIKGHTKSITALAVTADQSTVLSGSHDGVIVHWSAANGGQMDVVRAAGGVAQHKNQVQTIRCDPSAPHLAISCGLDDTLKFIDLHTFTYVYICDAI